mmetsp:Transcript_21313/g.26219  ORF Transcript_21313/g.26219 Transcript_21313/m.26219 type:complete len:98 (+) Transcript_21313:202-495(+)
MVNHAHAGDNTFGRSCKARTSVVVGIFMWVFPILWVPIDVLLNNHSSMSKTINDWTMTGIGFCQLTYLWLVAPIFLAFYETEAKDSMCSRILTALRI